MKGCRPLTDEEIPLVLAALGDGLLGFRNRALLLLGLKSGFRISELLSLHLRDVWQNGRLVAEISVQRKKMKGKKSGRSVPLKNPDARAALEQLIVAMHTAGHTDSDTPLFLSREGSKRPLNRRSAWLLLKKAYAMAGLSGKLATHTMRKTFAKQMKKLLKGDLQSLQKAMGHKEITSTMSYIEFDEAGLNDAFDKI